MVYAAAVFSYMFTVGSVGFWLPLHAKDLGYSYSFVTWLATTYFVFIALSTIIAGVLADITGRPRLLLVLGLILNAIANAILGFTDDYKVMLLARVIQGLGLSFILPIATGALTRLTNVRRGVEITAAMNGAGMSTGSLIGGLVMSRYGFTDLALIASTMSLFVATLLLWGPPPPPSPRVEIRDIVRAVRGAPRGVKVFFYALLLRNTLATGVYSVLSIIFSRIINLGLVETGLALSINPLTQFMMARVSSLISRRREETTYTIGLILTGVVLHLYYLASSFSDVIAAQILQGVSFSLIMVSGNNYIILNIPERYRYTASSLFPLAFNMGWVMGTFIAGPLMDLIGVMEYVLLAGVMIYVLSIGVYLALHIYNKE